MCTAVVLLNIVLSVFSLERYFFGTYPLPKKQVGGICSHPKLAGIIRPVRPVGPTGQTGVFKVQEILFGLHHWIGLVEYIKIHMWNVQIRVRMREI
jgi:hypothetical protein